MEKWDAYNGEFQKVEGVILTRGEPIPAGLFHLVCDVIVKHIDGSFLLMRRDPRKHFGGMWEATAGGSALKGESPFECAKRELREETGIEARELTEIGRAKQENTIYVEFLCETNYNKADVRLQEGETVDFKWVEKSELLKMKKDELVTERMRYYIEKLRL